MLLIIEQIGCVARLTATGDFVIGQQLGNLLVAAVACNKSPVIDTAP